jgi:hypothetical protein
LEAAGLDLGEVGWAKVKAALLTYKRLAGNLLVPRPFVVPHNHPKWPESTWGINLGRVTGSIRNDGSFKNHKQELVDMGFDFAKQANPLAIPWEVVEAALLAYKGLEDHLVVPDGFVVPHGDPKWPESTWGVRLGRIVANIRYNGYRFAHRQELLAMGLAFKKPTEE